MPDNAFLMIHAARTGMRGTQKDMARAGEMLGKVDGQLAAAYAEASARRGKKKTATDYLALMADGAREKRRHVTLDTIPIQMRQAVLAIEDQRFYSHFGVSPVRLAAAAIRNATNKDTVGYSTITQQLSRMFFLSDEFNAELQRSQQREAGERAPLDEPFLEPRDTSKLEKKEEKAKNN